MVWKPHLIRYSKSMLPLLFMKRKIQTIQPKTITVDIFDTILLRSWRPEQWRFYSFAREMQGAFKAAGLNVSRQFIYAHRKYYTQVIRANNQSNGVDFELSHTALMRTIVDEAARRNHVRLSSQKTARLVATLTKLELKSEFAGLKPNKSLLKILRSEKDQGTKLYFISDMYFSSTDIKQLLIAHKVDIFTGGISSADYLLGKSTGRAYQKMHEKYSQISSQNSLHIGDNRHSDYRVPRNAGTKSYLVILPMHRLKLWFGKILFGLLLRSRLRAVSTAQEEMYQARTMSKLNSYTNKSDQAQGIGWLFAPAIVYYLHTLGTRCELNKSQPLFVTGESEVFASLYKQLGFQKYKTWPMLNRTSLVQAYCAQMSKKNVQLSSLLPFVQKVLRRKNTTNALATLDIISPTSNQYLLLGRKALQPTALNALDTRSAQKLWASELKTILTKWKSLHKTKSSQYILADIGWNDTVQILLEEILKENSQETKLKGLYLGRTNSNIFDQRITTKATGVIFNSLQQNHAAYLYQPELWESFLNKDNVGNKTRDDILLGLAEAIAYFNASDLTAREFWYQNQQLLIENLQNPTRDLIESVANLQFDYGTKDEPICPLVNIHSTTPSTWKLLLRDRKAFKKFYFHQGWKWGAATYYHFRLPYRLWRFMTKKPSF